MLAPLWSELTSWLAVNAPRLYEHVRPPGDPARLASVEEQLGFALNAELVEWWQLHDGVVAGDIVPSYELFGVADMLRHHEIQRDVNFEEEVNAMARRNLGLADDEGGGPGW
jgi:cell wall assembly regulator SMI1